MWDFPTPLTLVFSQQLHNWAVCWSTVGEVGSTPKKILKVLKEAMGEAHGIKGSSL
jgi:hypothetical protein